MSAFGILQLPLWGCYAVYQQEGDTLFEKFRGALQPTADWGPIDPADNERYRKFMSDANGANDGLFGNRTVLRRMFDNVFG